MWWLICYLFFSLGQPVHHHHQKGLLMLSALNVVGILVFFGVCTINMYTNQRYFMPDIANTVLDIMRYVYWIVSLIGLIILKKKQHHGQLQHLSHECLNHHKLHFMIFLKFALMIMFWLIYAWPYSELRSFIANILLIVWWATVIHVASTRYLQSHLQVLPVVNHNVGHHHGHHAGMMVVAQPVVYA